MATPSTLSPFQARFTFKATRFLRSDAFICHRCLSRQAKPSSSSTTSALRSTRQSPFLTAFKQPRRLQSTTLPASPTLAEATSRPTSSSSSSSSSSWPHTSSKSTAYFLLASATSVFGLVVFGGLTRLTESGLSITEWRPVTGSLPPRSEEAWESEFARYKLSPEFKMLNSRMDIDDFKSIYWMEWTHRLWGRVVGVTFLVPTVYFIVRRRVTPGMAGRLVGIAGLIGFQGVLGWWMVKSGLKDDLFEQGKHPRVSQYRLAAHLGTAFVAYLAMVWNGLAILRENQLLKSPEEGRRVLQQLQRPELRRFKIALAALSILVFTTVLSGALVAGLDAGLIYNDFPWMGQGLVPPRSELLDPFYSHTSDRGDIVWRNMLENPVLVQLDHRILATTTFTAILALWAYSRFNPRVRAALPTSARKGVLGVVHLATLQVVLGISTLWYLVPTPVAAAHQAGALALLTGVAVLGSRVTVPGRSLRLVQKALEGAGKQHAGSRTVQRHMTTGSVVAS